MTFAPRLLGWARRRTGPSPRVSQIALGVALVAAAFLFASAPRASAWQTSDFTNLKARYYEWLTGGTGFNTRDTALQGKLRTINTRAETWWRSMDTTDPRDSLWADQMWPDNGGLFIQVSYDRLREMALAYKTPCSSGMGYTCLYRNTTLRDDIIGGLDWLYNEWYHPGVSRPTNANWYIYEIGSPDYLIQSMILLESELTSRQKSDWLAAIQNFIEVTYENGYGSGANRAWGARVFLGVGALLGGSTGDAYVRLARDGMSAFGSLPSMFAYRTTAGDRGFFEDGSYMDHSWYAYTGGYGTAYYESVSSVVYLLGGSIWAVTDTDKSKLVEFGLNAFAPLVYRGAILPAVMGRGLTDPDWTDHHSAHSIFAPLLTNIDLAGRTDALTIKQLLKEWISKDTYIDYYADQYTTMFSVLRAQAIMTDSGVTAGDQAIERQYRQMDRAVIQRPATGANDPGYMFGVAMTSRDRTESYESILGNNRRGWHQGDGATYLYPGNEIDQYTNYWQTVDSNRLAGTTVEYGSQPAKYSTDNDWTGGASTGTYGAAGMYLQRPSGTMEAKKSWFMFDDEIVAVGTGVTGTGSATVETVIDNRKIRDDNGNWFLSNGTAQSTSLPWSSTLSSVNWLWLRGNASDSDIGYYFPTGPLSVKAKREARTGCWADVNDDLSTCPPASTTTKNYLTLWFDHGVRPSNAKYAYAILPNKDDTETAAYARSPDISILKRDNDVHAVRDVTMDWGMIQANFWNDTNATFDVGSHTPWFGSDKKASVITLQTYDGVNDYLDVWVADPTQRNTGNITLTFYGRTLRTVAADPEVTISSTSPTTVARVNVNGTKGKTIHYRIAFAY